MFDLFENGIDLLIHLRQEVEKTLKQHEVVSHEVIAIMFTNNDIITGAVAGHVTQTKTT